MSDKLIIFDTTLRDGEQAPGCSMTLREKLMVGHALADLGVDVIEAGFPAASPGDLEAVRTVAKEIEGPIICGLARCEPGDIERAAHGVEPAARKRIHVFIASSPIHREHKLQMSRSQVIESAVAGVRLARQFCEDVEFSAEDALRTEPEFLVELATAAIEAGAGTINIPDTVGYTAPGEIAALFDYLLERAPSLQNAILSTHCHNDLGMAVANSLAAVGAGARQVECTINGIGERAGNCSLEELVMAVRTRAEYFGVHTGIETTRLYPTSRLVSGVTGLHVARNKAIVGANAFAHEAGIHQHGMLQNASTYEIMRPQDVGIASTSLVLGKHSGRHAFRARVAELGFELDEEALQSAFKDFKNLADRKKDLHDADIEAIVLRGEVGRGGPWKLDRLQIASGGGNNARAIVQLAHEDGRISSEAGTGSGPVEAAFAAIERAAGMPMELTGFDVRSVTEGEDALGEASVIVQYEGRSYHGRGVSTDIIEASAAAFVEAVNRVAHIVEHAATEANAEATTGTATQTAAETAA